MVYARVTDDGPIIEYSGTGAHVPDGYIIVDEKSAMAELAKDEQVLAEELALMKDTHDALLAGAFTSLTKGLPLAADEAKALGARPLPEK